MGRSESKEQRWEIMDGREKDEDRGEEGVINNPLAIIKTKTALGYVFLEAAKYVGGVGYLLAQPAAQANIRLQRAERREDRRKSSPWVR